MRTAVGCAGPSFWIFSSKRAQDAQGQCRPIGMTALCILGSQVPLTKHAYSAGASWSARPARQRLKDRAASTLIVYGVDHLGLEPFVDGKSSQEDASAPQTTQEPTDSPSPLASTSEESEIASGGGAPDLVGTDGIIFEDNGLLSQPRNHLDEDTDNWQLFASEEGARAATAETDSSSSTDDDLTGSDSETEGAVRRRKAEDVLPFPGTDATNLTTADKEKIKSLQDYKYRHASKGGLFVVEAMRPKHMNDTEELLVDSFAELMGGLLTYRPLLALTVKQYVRERYATLPHSVTLVGLYAPVEGASVTAESPDRHQGLWVVAGTVELSFSVAGHPYVPTPAPPPNSPYICNMAVRKDYRRRGLGRQMLKAAEELALRMGCEDMYLHVRMVDTAPLTMYREAGYQVVSTDSLLAVLTFQRRRHLMRKRLSRAKLVPE